MALAERSDDGRIGLIGHSLGMHHAAMTTLQAQARIRSAISAAAGAGCGRDWAPASRNKAPLMLHVAGPLLTPLFGYFPGKRLRMDGDLPARVMRQWSRWCRHPEFVWGTEPDLVLPGFENARFPIRALSFTDDEAMTEACTRRLLVAFKNAPSTLQVLSPGKLGMKSVGHVGAFRVEARDMLWPLLEEALECIVQSS